MCEEKYRGVPENRNSWVGNQHRSSNGNMKDGSQCVGSSAESQSRESHASDPLCSCFEACIFSFSPRRPS